MKDKFEIYDVSRLDGRRILCNGKIINEFGLLEKVEKLSIQNDALRRKLIEVANELKFMIDRENERLEGQISCTDLDDPDYFDHQTVVEAMELANT